MKIIFFGTPQIAVPFLDALISDKYFDVALTVTQADAAAGRGMEIAQSPVKIFALKNSLRVIEPKTLKADEVINEITAVKPDLMVVVAYGKIIPKNILDLAPIVNMHPSILPRWRGATPIQTAIMAGDKVSGISIMLIDELMDHGPILTSNEIALSENETYETLQNKVMEIGPQMLIDAIKKFANREIIPTPQKENNATYCKVIKNEDTRIDWTKPAVEIERTTRALFPVPAAFTIWKREGTDVRLKILKCVALSDESSSSKNAGIVSVENNKLIVSAGVESIEIIELQPSGKRAMSAKEFINGNKQIQGVILE